MAGFHPNANVNTIQFNVIKKKTIPRTCDHHLAAITVEESTKANLLLQTLTVTQRVCHVIQNTTVLATYTFDLRAKTDGLYELFERYLPANDSLYTRNTHGLYTGAVLEHNNIEIDGQVREYERKGEKIE